MYFKQNGCCFIALAHVIRVHRMGHLRCINRERRGAQCLRDCLAAIDATPSGVSTRGKKCVRAHGVECEQRSEFGGKGEFKSHAVSLPRLHREVHPLVDVVIGIE